jgi:hypothetical protein
VAIGVEEQGIQQIDDRQQLADPAIIERSTREDGASAAAATAASRRSIMPDNEIRRPRAPGNPTKGDEWITTFR